MRVSIINLNLVGHDAIGQNILEQVRFFRRNGDDVRIFTEHPPQGVASDIVDLTRVVTLADLLAGRDAHFSATDLYIYHYPGRYTLLDSMRTLARGVVILYFHNVTPPELWHAAGDDEVVKQLRVSVESIPALAGFADLIVTDSNFNAANLIGDHGVDADRVRVLPLSVPLTEFAPGPADPALLERYGLRGKRVLLYVGRMAGNKRVDLLVNALATLQERVPDAALLLVGDTDANASFREVVANAKVRAMALGVADDVHFVGRVDDLAAHYRLADLYVSASLHEGFGVPVLEAMASGVPVVVSNVAAHPDVTGEAGLLAIPGDADDLARQAARVLMDDGLYGDLVQRGLARVVDFSPERYAHGWAQIVHEVTEWLPAGPYPGPLVEAQNAPPRRRQTIDVEFIGSLLDDDLHQLEVRAATMQHDYVVHSRLPLFGPLLAWFRRNITSHLREPYVDPTFERQELFNWQVVQTMQLLSAQLTRVQGDPDALAAAQARIEELEQELATLRAEVARRDDGSTSS